jgi:hypothetical protein
MTDFRIMFICSFSCLSDTRHQYKYGEDGSMKSFVLELVWGPEYPAEPPGKSSSDP